MYSAAFIFEVWNRDQEFQKLDRLVEEAAESLSGYLGKEVWKAMEGSRINATYYWKNEEALKEFVVHPKHLEAKRQYSRWYSGYHVVISKVKHSLGTGLFRIDSRSRRGSHSRLYSAPSV